MPETSIENVDGVLIVRFPGERECVVFDLKECLIEVVEIANN